jgi:hypothetical protein
MAENARSHRGAALWVVLDGAALVVLGGVAGELEGRPGGRSRPLDVRRVFSGVYELTYRAPGLQRLRLRRVELPPDQLAVAKAKSIAPRAATSMPLPARRFVVCDLRRR